MKKEYTEAETEIILIDTQDVITTSGGDGLPDDYFPNGFGDGSL